MSKFRDVGVVITVAADGIGLALARSFGKRGSRIAMLDIRTEAVTAAADQLKEAGIDAVPITCADYL